MPQGGGPAGPCLGDELPRQFVGHLLGLSTAALLAGEEQGGPPLLGVNHLSHHPPPLRFLQPDLGQGTTPLDHQLLQTGQLAEDARGGTFEVGAVAEVVGAVPEQATIRGI